MKISQQKVTFSPVTITLETTEDLVKFRELVNFAFNESSSDSSVENIAGQYIEVITKL